MVEAEGARCPVVPREPETRTSALPMAEENVVPNLTVQRQLLVAQPCVHHMEEVNDAPWKVVQRVLSPAQIFVSVTEVGENVHSELATRLPEARRCSVQLMEVVQGVFTWGAREQQPIKSVYAELITTQLVLVGWRRQLRQLLWYPQLSLLPTHHYFKWGRHQSMFPIILVLGIFPVRER
mmetsp:Transcript_43611/g.63903  ORF Transcript_43611/g.63903 Transcript_43611/m.63903 type:complete len:180 (+) Transcript_43611:1033-1572(+)